MADTGSREPSQGRDFVPLLVGLLLAAAVLALGWAAERVAMRSHHVLQQAQVLKTLSGLSARLGGALEANMLVGQGLADYVASSGGLAEGQFEAIARNLLAHRSEVRHVALIHGTVVTDIYPRIGNEAALGLDLRDLPDQWPALRDAIERGMPMLGPPVIPVQGGGLVLISRVPVHAPAPRGQSYRYWGVVSTVIDFDALMRRAGVDEEMPISPVLRVVTNRGLDGAVFFGDPAVLDAVPETVTFSVPGGSWILSGIPAGGWQEPTALAWSLRGGAVSLSVFIGWIGTIMTAQWRSLRRSHRQAMIGSQRHDTMTGLLSRDGFLRAGDHDLARARQEGSTVALMLVDVDRLAALNLAQGAAAGDRAVEALSAVLKKFARPADLVARLEGGTFALLLAGATAHGAALVADKIIHAVRHPTQVPSPAGQGGFSVSVGIAVARDYDLGIQDVLVRAGERLASAKLAGRDRVAV